MSQFDLESVNDKSAFVYCPKVGSKTGESKDQQGGILYVNLSLKRISILDIDLIHGRLNAFKLIEKYFEAQQLAGITHNRFLLGVRWWQKQHPSRFFSARTIGKNKMSNIAKEVRQSRGICG